MTSRPIHQIAHDILKAWPKPYFGATPYLRAMFALDTIDQNYGYDSGKSVVLGFLSNAASWRGETARRIKSELRGVTK